MVLSRNTSQRLYVAIGMDTRLLSTQLRLPRAIITRSRALKIREIIRPISWPGDSGILVFSSGGRRKRAEKLLFKCLLLKRKTMSAFTITIAKGRRSRRVICSWATLRGDHALRSCFRKGRLHSRLARPAKRAISALTSRIPRLGQMTVPIKPRSGESKLRGGRQID